MRTELPAGSPANGIALRAITAILDAAHDFDISIEGTRISVAVQRRPPPPPPRMRDIPEGTPVPAAVLARCTWEGGAVELLAETRLWRQNGPYKRLVLVSVAVASTGDQLVSITVPLYLADTHDGESAPIPANLAPTRRRDEDEEDVRANDGGALAVKSLVERAGLPMASRFRVEAFRVRVPSAEVEPAPVVAFERLIHLALIKLPFFLRGRPGVVGRLPFVVAGKPIDVPEPEVASAGKRGGLYPLPGGVRQFKTTLDALLEFAASGPHSLDAVYEMFEEQYEVTGVTARKTYIRLLTALGYWSVGEAGVELTADGAAYLARKDPADVFERLHRTFSGILELLVVIGLLGTASAEAMERMLQGLLDVTWESANQTGFRRNWLLSLGLTDRSSKGDSLTDAGRTMLERHAGEVATIRARAQEFLEENDSDDEDDEDVDERPPIGSARPAAWDVDRLDLSAELVTGHVALQVPRVLLERAAAALSSGKHLLIVGPPGTGKTELAHALVEAARTETYCAGALVATASADWTTFDTVGGYALQRDSGLRFRPGVFLRALERWQWLIIDELNRADVDRAFGELMTVLSNRSVSTAFENDAGQLVTVGPSPTATHFVPKTFRVIATMNTWDKTSLFRLSYAVQRRFAILHVGVPNDDDYAAILRKVARDGLDAPLPSEALAPLSELFSTRGLFAAREIGPAVAIDVVRYMRRRQASGDGLAEALVMYVLPQLEGLEQTPAVVALEAMRRSLAGWTTPDAATELRDRFQDLFPHVKLPA